MKAPPVRPGPSHRSARRVWWDRRDRSPADGRVRERPFSAWSRWDVVGFVMALALGLPSLGFRYGRDQALFHYVGREWFTGRLPYRDVFDIKPPAVYLLYGLNDWWFGAQTWGIRALDLVSVVAAGIVAGWLATPLGARPNGRIGVGALIGVAAYYTLLDPWHSAQVEGFGALAIVLGLTVAVRGSAHGPRASKQPSSTRQGWRLGLGVGACAAIAVLFKVTLAIPGLTLGFVLVARMLVAPAHKFRGALMAILGAFVGGAVTVSVPLVLLAAWGASDAMLELVEYLSSYRSAVAKPHLQALDEFWLQRAFPLTVTLALFAVPKLLRRRARSLVFVGAAMILGASVGSVSLQQKYFLYHWGAVIAPLVAVLVIAVTGRASPLQSPLARVVSAVGFAALLILMAPSWQSDPRYTYRAYLSHHPFLVPGAPGEKARDGFGYGEAAWSWETQRELAHLVLAQHPEAGDRLYIRGYEPGAYILTGMSAPFRFVVDEHFWFARSPLTLRWEREQEAELAEVRPRFVVTFLDRFHDVRKLTRLGYTRIGRVAGMVLMEQEPNAEETDDGAANGGQTDSEKMPFDGPPSKTPRANPRPNR